MELHFALLPRLEISAHSTISRFALRQLPSHLIGLLRANLDGARCGAFDYFIIKCKPAHEHELRCNQLGSDLSRECPTFHLPHPHPRRLFAIRNPIGWCVHCALRNIQHKQWLRCRANRSSQQQQQQQKINKYFYGFCLRGFMRL